MSSIRKGGLRLGSLRGGGGGGGPTPSPSAPTNYIAPSIFGTPEVGNTLVVNPGSWGGYPSPSVSRAWLRNGVATGVVATSYLLTSADEGKTITVKETAGNASGSANATSAGVSVTSTGGGTVDPTLDAPVLTKTSAAGASPFAFDEAIPANVSTGFFRQVQVATDAGFASITQDLFKSVTEGELAGDYADWQSLTQPQPPRRTADAVLEPLLLTWGGQHYLRMRYFYDLDNGDGTVTRVASAWSNVIGDDIEVVTRWFLRFNSNGRDDSNSTILGNLVFRATPGGPDLALTGSPFGDSSSPAAWGPNRAFDGNPDTHYNSTAPTTAHPVLGLFFASGGPASIHDFDIQNTNNSDGLVQYIWGPVNFDLYKTVGGVDVFVQNFATPGWVTENETRNFLVTA